MLISGVAFKHVGAWKMFFFRAGRTGFGQLGLVDSSCGSCSYSYSFPPVFAESNIYSRQHGCIITRLGISVVSLEIPDEYERNTVRCVLELHSSPWNDNSNEQRL